MSESCFNSPALLVSLYIQTKDMGQYSTGRKTRYHPAFIATGQVYILARVE